MRFSLLYIYIYLYTYILLYIQCRGMERTYEAPSNEAPHMILGYHQGRLVTYLQHHFIFRQWRPAKPSTGMTHFKSTGFFFLNGCRNLTSIPVNYHGLSCIRTFSCFEQGRRKHTFLKVSHFNSSKYTCQVYWIVFAREMHSTSVIR